jgi:hypothetical protein
MNKQQELKIIIKDWRNALHSDIKDEQEHLEFLDSVIETISQICPQKVNQLSDNRKYCLYKIKCYSYAHNLDYKKAKKWSDKATEWEQKTLEGNMENPDGHYSICFNRDEETGEVKKIDHGSKEAGMLGLAEGMKTGYEYRQKVLGATRDLTIMKEKVLS